MQKLNTRILIVDDNIQFCRSMQYSIKQYGYLCEYITDPQVALKSILESAADLLLLDVMLKNESGLDLLRAVHNANPKIPVVIITGFASIDSAVEAIRIGAVDYIQKPIKFDRLLKLIENLARPDAVTFTGSVSEAQQNNTILTKNPSMLAILAKVRLLASSQLPILLVGESGTGKEMFADFAHLHSDRSAKQMLKVNCGAFPDSLLDNELFGHEKGAYTGATIRFRGMFEEADGSSLFLDEIGDMSLQTQSKILRVLQNCEVRRLGGDRTIKVDVRFIAATNKSLESLIQQGRFRRDLYYRLEAATIEIPPLLKRKDDILLLAEHFLQQCNAREPKKATKISADVMDIFFGYDWPGNIRELRNCVSYAHALAAGNEICRADLPPKFSSILSSFPTYGAIEESEKWVLTSAMIRFEQNKVKVSQFLKISRTSLYNKLRKYGLWQ